MHLLQGLSAAYKELLRQGDCLAIANPDPDPEPNPNQVYWGSEATDPAQRVALPVTVAVYSHKVSQHARVRVGVRVRVRVQVACSLCSPLCASRPTSPPCQPIPPRHPHPTPPLPTTGHHPLSTTPQGEHKLHANEDRHFHAVDFGKEVLAYLLWLQGYYGYRQAMDTLWLQTLWLQTLWLQTGYRHTMATD